MRKITRNQMFQIKRAGYGLDTDVWINDQQLPVIVTQLTEAGYGNFYAVKVQPSGNLTRIKEIKGGRPDEVRPALIKYATQRGWEKEWFDLLEVEL